MQAHGFFIPSYQLKTNALLIFGNKLSIHAYNKSSSKNLYVLGYLHSTSLTFDFMRVVPVPLIRIVKDYIICCYLNSLPPYLSFDTHRSMPCDATI